MKNHGNFGNTWTRFLNNKPAIAGFYFIVLVLFISIFGAVLRPDKTPNANVQIMGAAKLPPLSRVKILRVHSNQEIKPTPFFKKLLFGGEQETFKQVPFSDYSFEGMSIVLTDPQNPASSWKKNYLLPDVLYPIDDAELERLRSVKVTEGTIDFITSDGEEITTTIAALQKGTEKQVVQRLFWLGTDSYGRDMLSRLMAGSLISFSVGFVAVLISLILGMSLGSIAGYFGGKTDQLIQWIMNVIWSIPGILLVIAISFVLGKGLAAIFIAIGAILWVELARVVRGLVLSLREREFVKAARLMQFSDFRIIFRHIYPNMVGPVVVICASNFASAIMMEAGLSFLGIGIQPPTPSWGNMIREHYGFIITDGAYLAIVPGLAIVLLILSFILVGNGLREASDYRLGPQQSTRA